MLSLIKKIITAAPAKSAAAPAAASEDQRRLAACVLLLEAAHIDDECTGQEMEQVVKQQVWSPQALETFMDTWSQHIIHTDMKLNNRASQTMN